MSETWCRSQYVWFEEGTVVLEADGVLFRPIRGLLVNQGTVFAEILTIPQNTDPAPGDVYDGCTLVHMQDSSRDLENFLRALHDPGFYNHASATPFDIISGILRLSAKYNVPFLRRRCIAHLTLSCPTTLLDWEIQNLLPQKMAVVNINYVELVNLLREVNALALLPAALYRLCITESLSAICYGTPGPSGTFYQLNETDHLVCVSAHPEFADISRRAAYNALVEVPDCSNAACRKRRSALATYASITSKFGTDAFIRYERDGALCSACNDEWDTRIDKVKKLLWDALPGLFQLQSWQELAASAAASDVD